MAHFSFSPHGPKTCLRSRATTVVFTTLIGLLSLFALLAILPMSRYKAYALLTVTNWRQHVHLNILFLDNGNCMRTDGALEGLVEEG
jgi:hypothetical protein